MDLSIIIVSYNTKKILEDCLRTINKSKDNLKKEVIVVDNQSSDGSLDMVKKKFPNIRAIASGGNLGFAKGNNLGAKYAKGQYIWLLNSDTILKTNTISKLMNLVQQNQSQIASCRLLNKDGSIQPQGGCLPALLKLTAWMLFIDDIPLVNKLIRPYQQQRRGYFRKDQHPGWLGGTALLIKADVYRQMKGLDKNIFMYGEDIEFCYRAAKNGIRLDYFAEPQLTHLGQASGSSRGAVLGEYRGLKYFYKKHKQGWEYPILRLLLKIGALLRVTIFGILLRDETRKAIYQEAYRLA